MRADKQRHAVGSSFHVKTLRKTNLTIFQSTVAWAVNCYIYIMKWGWKGWPKKSHRLGPLNVVIKQLSKFTTGFSRRDNHFVQAAYFLSTCTHLHILHNCHIHTLSHSCTFKLFLFKIKKMLGNDKLKLNSQ